MNPLLEFKCAVQAQKGPRTHLAGFQRDITHKGKRYTLKAIYREYGYVNWSIWHNGQEIAWTDQSREFENLLPKL